MTAEQAAIIAGIATPIAALGIGLLMQNRTVFVNEAKERISMLRDSRDEWRKRAEECEATNRRATFHLVEPTEGS